MKKITTRIRFIDSTSKEFISKKLKDACEKTILDYNEDTTIKSPMLKVGKFENGDWDTKFKDGMKELKKISLLEYTDEDGVLDFDKLFEEFYEFLTSKKVDDKLVNLKDEEELVEEEVDEAEVTEVLEEVKEDDNNTEDESTYGEYFKEEAKSLDKSDFRTYLIKIILGESKGWSYLKSPNSIEGSEYDIVTPKNAKKIAKSFTENNK